MDGCRGIGVGHFICKMANQTMKPTPERSALLSGGVCSAARLIGNVNADVVRLITVSQESTGRDTLAQIKIYGLRANIEKHRASLSESIHTSVMDALSYPAEKRFHRFIALEPEDFVFPSDRTPQYTIIEISMFEGRSIETKKALVRALYKNIGSDCGIEANDVEITIIETPKENWGIRGVPGDELSLNYKVNV